MNKILIVYNAYNILLILLKQITNLSFILSNYYQVNTLSTDQKIYHFWKSVN